MAKYIQRRKVGSGCHKMAPGPKGQGCGIGAFRVVESTRWLLIFWEEAGVREQE